MFRKKSKYKHVKINKKKYYFYKISWLDITADGGHATREEFDRFKNKLDCFWNLYNNYHKGEPLISLEYFLANPSSNLAKLSNFFNINSNQVVDIPIPVELGVAYNDKFKNYDEIIEWFENYE